MPSGVTGALLMASRNKHKISYSRQYLVVRKGIDRDGRSRTREFILEITRHRKSISRNGEAQIRPSSIERQKGMKREGVSITISASIGYKDARPAMTAARTFPEKIDD